MVEVTIEHFDIFGDHLYRIYFDGVLHAHFMSKIRLTEKEEQDIVDGFQESLEALADLDSVV